MTNEKQTDVQKENSSHFFHDISYHIQSLLAKQGRMFIELLDWLQIRVISLLGN